MPGALPDVVTTERLRLPLWSATEAEAVRRGIRPPADHPIRWHPDFPRPDDADAATLWTGGDPWGPRSIVRGVTVLGSIGCFGPPEEAADGVGEVEVGFGLVPEAHGWGFGTEALRGLLAAVDRCAVRTRARVAPTNARALRVLAACGFTDLRGGGEDDELVMARPVPVAER